MNLIQRWNAYMGPKDERLVAENNRCMRVGYIILMAGAGIAGYYAIMVDQVADTTGTPIYTAAGLNVFPVSTVILLALLISCLVTVILEAKAGVVDEHVRLAAVEQVPWDLCVLAGLVAGAFVGVITTGARMLAEVQIVGVENVTWAGDIAMGVVFFVIAFVLATFGTAAFFASAIKQRKLIEAKLDED